MTTMNYQILRGPKSFINSPLLPLYKECSSSDTETDANCLEEVSNLKTIL